MASTKRMQPTGQCWCGCGGGTQPGRFFLANHDRVAGAAVIEVVYGGIPQLLAAHGLGSGGRIPRRERDQLRREG